MRKCGELEDSLVSRCAIPAIKRSVKILVSSSDRLIAETRDLYAVPREISTKRAQ